MATIETKACVICMNDFDTAARRPAALPCGHTFCLTCLCRLKSSGSPVCPQCRKNFKEVQLPELSSTMASGYTSSFKNDQKIAKAQDFVGCKKHKESFVYWSTISNELYCTTCILSVNIQTSCLKRISDAIPLIQNNLESKAQAVNQGLSSNLANLKEERKKAIEELLKIETFEECILKLKAEYQQFIGKVDAHSCKLREQSTLVNKIEMKIPEIESEQDIKNALDYGKTLDKLHKKFACHQKGQVPQHNRGVRAIGYYEASSSTNKISRSCKQVEQMKRPANLLGDIACAFEEGQQHYGTFNQKLQLKMRNRTSPSYTSVSSISYDSEEDSSSGDDDEDSRSDDEESKPHWFHKK